jgi:lipopolysaccharide export system permease protein
LRARIGARKRATYGADICAFRTKGHGEEAAERGAKASQCRFSTNLVERKPIAGEIVFSKSCFAADGLGFACDARVRLMPHVNTFDRHLLREWLQILGLVLAATCGLLLVQVLYEDFRQLRDLGARGSVFWRYLAVTMPSFFAVVLPLALLVSLLYVLGRLHRANELTAMRTAGVGFARLTAPVWLVGLICCGVSWWLNTTVVPWSVEESRAMKDELEFRHQSTKAVPPDRIGAVNSVAFDNPIERRMWFFNRYSKSTNRGYGVSVSVLDPARREVSRLTAAEAWLDAERNGWVFKHGRELTFAPETGELIGSRPFEEQFEPKYREQPSLMLLIDRKPTHLSLWELAELVSYLEIERSPKLAQYAVRYYGLIADVIGPLIVIAIAIPFAVSGVRVNPAVGVSKSIGLFFLYYVFTSFSTTLAAKGYVEPVVAAWLPHAGMSLIAIWFFARLR